MGLTSYGKNSGDGDPQDPWTSATGEAGTHASAVVEEPPATASSTPSPPASSEGGTQNGDKTNWGEVATNVIKSVADAIIQSRTPGGSDEGSEATGGDVGGGPRGGDAGTGTTGGISSAPTENSEDPFVGTWYATETDTSPSHNLDSHGNECGRLHNEDEYIRFRISKTADGYTFTNYPFAWYREEKSIRVSSSSILFSEIEDRDSHWRESAEVELSGEGLKGTIWSRSSTGCLYVLSFYTTGKEQ
jgi:hypothetical protein